jgi:hypothetical protein
MIVGVDWLLGAHCAAKNLDSSVADDLVRVHVRLSTRSGLPDNQREMFNQLEISNLLGSLLDSFADFGI